MAIAMRFVPEQRLAIMTAQGPIALADFDQALRMFRTDPRMTSNMNRLWDFRAATLQLTATDVRRIAMNLQQQAISRPGARSALVMGSIVAYGLARMFQIYADILGLPTDFGVFREVDEALAWLGVDSAALGAGDG